MEIGTTLNETEKRILRELVTNKEPISPYDIFPKIGVSYQGVHKYGKTLSEKGLITINTVEGMTRTKKNMYSLTFKGLVWIFAFEPLIIKDKPLFYDILTNHKELHPLIPIIINLWGKIDSYSNKDEISAYQESITVALNMVCVMTINFDNCNEGFAYHIFKTLSQGYLSKGYLNHQDTHFKKFFPDLINAFKEDNEVWEDLYRYFEGDYERNVLYEVRFYSLIFSEEFIINSVKCVLEEKN